MYQTRKDRIISRFSDTRRDIWISDLSGPRDIYFEDIEGPPHGLDIFLEYYVFFKW